MKAAAEEKSPNSMHFVAMHDGLHSPHHHHHKQDLPPLAVHLETSSLHAAPQPHNQLELVVGYLGILGKFSFKMLFSANNQTFSDEA